MTHPQTPRQYPKNQQRQPLQLPNSAEFSRPNAPPPVTSPTEHAAIPESTATESEELGNPFSLSQLQHPNKPANHLKSLFQQQQRL